MCVCEYMYLYRFIDHKTKNSCGGATFEEACVTCVCVWVCVCVTCVCDVCLCVCVLGVGLTL